MAKKNTQNEAGNVDWARLERTEKKAKKKKQEDNTSYNPKAIEDEKQKLPEDDKQLPYPDDFLADVNLLNKSIGNYRPAKQGGESTDEITQTEE